MQKIWQVAAIFLLYAGPSAGHAQETLPVRYVEAALDKGEITTAAHGPQSTDTLYQIGSVAKFACSLAAIDMVKEGRLSLSDNVSDILAGYAGVDGGQLKLIHVLQNRSGLEEKIMAAFRSNPQLPNTKMPSLEAANSFASGPLKFAPGDQFDYIIANWILLQAVLEQADNASISDILQRRVFMPAGMDNTLVFSGTPSGENIAEHSVRTRPIPDFITCAGGVASTASDLVKLVRHPYQSANFSETLLIDLITIYTHEEDYALGGRYRVFDGNHWSWQSGSNGAYKVIAIYSAALDKGYAIATSDNAQDVIRLRRDEWLNTLLK